MNRKKINLLLITLIIVMIIDSGFRNIRFLDALKVLLLIVCLILNSRKDPDT